MKKTAYLINVARGSIINKKVLYKVLKKGWLEQAWTFTRMGPHTKNPLFKLDKLWHISPHLNRTSLPQMGMSSISHILYQ